MGLEFNVDLTNLFPEAGFATMPSTITNHTVHVPHSRVEIRSCYIIESLCTRLPGVVTNDL